MINIPKNTILKPTGLGDSIGDAVETFNLDLSSNYGAIRTTGMKNVFNSFNEIENATVFASVADFPVTGNSALVYYATAEDDYYVWNGSSYELFSGMKHMVAFAKYNDDYYGVTDDFVYKGDDTMNEPFTKETSSGAPDGETSISFSDMKVFNEALYVSGSNEIMKKDGTTWSTPISSGVTSGTPHLMETYGDLLYFTDDYVSVKSITTSDVVNTTTSTLDLGLDKKQWTITMLKASKDRMWIGLLNTVTGKGRMYQWDGFTENTPTDYTELETGIMAGVILNNVPYIFDSNGKVMAFAGGSFSEKARVFKKTDVTFDGVDTLVNIRFIHPNGMAVTDYGTILIFFSNEITILNTENKEYTVPSGIYEYDPQVGLYHRHSISFSVSGSTLVTDYGQQSITRTDVGAVYFDRSSRKRLTDNGNILCSCRYYVDANTSNARYGIFTDDTLDTTQKYGYFITSKIYSKNIQEVWQSVYSVYEKLKKSTDKIILKYRTKEDDPTEVFLTWVTTDSITTTDDVSDYEVGDEIQVIQGSGGGKTAHITSITESGGTYSISLDDTFTGASGTSKALISKWKKIGEANPQHPQQWKEHTLKEESTSPYVQIKVCMQFTGKNQLRKISIKSRDNIK